jgi:hypothetical protein
VSRADRERLAAESDDPAWWRGAVAARYLAQESDDEMRNANER